MEAGLILKEERLRGLRGLRGQEGLREKPERIDGGFRQCCRSQQGRRRRERGFPKFLGLWEELKSTDLGS